MRDFCSVEIFHSEKTLSDPGFALFLCPSGPFAFPSGRAGRLDRAGAKMTVHVPRTNIVTPAAMRFFAGFRDRILLQQGGLTHYD
jgi:hypothetical protein